MHCPLFTAASWLRLEHYQCYPPSVPHGPSQLERIPLDAFAVWGHRYWYVPRTSSEEHCLFKAVYGAGDQYLFNKVPGGGGAQQKSAVSPFFRTPSP